VRRAALLLAALLAFAAALPAGAPGAAPRTSLTDIEDEVMCDVCGVPLNIAESPRADQQRKEIRALIDRGLTKDQIKAELKRTYGPAILATPQDEGFDLAAYLVPVAVVLGCVALLAALLPRWRRRPPSGPAAGTGPPPAVSAAEERRLEEDLARYDV